MQQKLQANERGVSLHDGKGNFLGYEDIVTLSDEELAEETEEKEIAQIINNLKDNNVKKVFLRLRKTGSLP